MPKIVSRSQLRWAHWAAKKGRGKTRKAGRNAISEFRGKTTRGFPERKKRRGRATTKKRSRS